MVGGGKGGYIGPTHRLAARIDDCYELVAGALSSDPLRSVESAQELQLDPARSYVDYRNMARAESQRKDGIDVVVIVTPNHLHAPIAKEFLNAGIHVICDKPLTVSLQEALELQALSRSTGMLLVLTHTYSGYPMVRHAKELVSQGELGEIRFIHVEYVQEWLAEPVERSGNRQAEWRTDPERSGPGGGASRTSARMPTNWPLTSQESFLRRSPQKSSPWYRDADWMIMSRRCCAIHLEAVGFLSRVKLRRAKETPCGCASMEAKPRSPSIRNNRTFFGIHHSTAVRFG
jgi:hypothetical protein